MKKLLFLVITTLASVGLFAQQGEMSALGNVGFQTDVKRFMIGAQGRYNITDDIRLAPDIMLLFPKDKLIGLDVNANIHYVLNSGAQLEVYPLAGLAIQNNHQGERKITNIGSNEVLKTQSNSFTKIGVNVGTGFTYGLAENRFANFEMKYVIGGQHCFVFALGYGLVF